MTRRYPDRPGFKDATVSRDNVLGSRTVFFNRMQRRVLELYRAGFVGTADEAADRLAISPFSARPRCTELLKMGLLERHRIDRSIPGRSAWVLRLKAAQGELRL